MSLLPLIIAEVKTASPFWYRSTETWETLFEVAHTVWDIISIHTDSRWWWSMELISRAKQLTDKPILAKGIHSQDSEILEALKRGAEYILIVWRIPEIHRDKCFIEPNTLKELEEFASILWWDWKFVWNSRDLKTWGLKIETFQDARNIFPWWLCQASNIKTTSDIISWASAILVWTHLKEFSKTML